MADAHAVRRGRLEPPLLVTRVVNVRYLTGFSGSNAALLITPDGAVLATDGRYRTQAAAQAPDVELLVDRSVATALVARAAQDGVRRLAVEGHDVTLELAAALRTATPAVELTTATSRPVEALRAVKDEGEIGLLREACAIADAALTGLLADGGVRAGRTERAVRDDLEARLRALGADGPAFETIVATGPHSAVPHHRPTSRPVQRGDLVKIDFGALRAGYHSDCTRTVVVGPPAEWQREVHALVLAAQAVGRGALRVGADVPGVDEAARAVVRDAGHDEHYPHGLGHGVGLEIHEAPMIGYRSPGTLAAGMPVTVEPGVYLPGRGGVRIEDTLVVRQDGPELLTTTTRDLLVL